ncbi:hypothetical protein ACFCX4_08660 [Kitasatospora sp. NPDC056327]|uniref:hypothetical protein n=1 Tax=Kitasatospora sp. NPDC056327 TaxID=3345785 RepID=UPI0035D6A50F
MRRAPRALVRALAAVAIIAAVSAVSSPEDWGWQPEHLDRGNVARSQAMSNDWGWGAPAPQATAAVVPAAQQRLLAQDWGW